MKSMRALVLVMGLALVFVFGVFVLQTNAAPSGSSTYATVVQARNAGPDFDIQGEYLGIIAGDAKRKIGIQVIALGDGKFQAVFLPGGLPGAGSGGKKKILCQGKLEGAKAVFTPAKGDRQYLAGNPDEFSATKQFPPKTQADYTAVIEKGKLEGKTDKGETIKAKKLDRKSPTLGFKPPAAATVLLPYEPNKAPSLAQMSNQKWKADPNGYMQAMPKAGQIETNEKFSGPWAMHIEFRSPFQPKARGQGRGNSGVFPPGGQEIQVLDSFGLDGLPNECGGIYKTNPPIVNMCLPPLSWQTYDITYNPGNADEQAWYWVVHNGVVIHKKLQLGKPKSDPVSLKLQDHGNPVAYRNIWIVKGTKTNK